MAARPQRRPDRGKLDRGKLDRRKRDIVVAVKLRLMRMGKKKQPTYRVVAADSRSPRDGRFIEIVGTYEPRSEPSVVKIDNAKVLKWLSDGAQPTDTVQKLLQISGAWDEYRAVAGTKTTTKAATSRAASVKAAAGAR
jgi:small subunit ribosomal protein S16